jgi:exodeoxyribonuclease-3
MRIATWNVNSVRARLPRLLGWLADAQPDVVCLQETKCSADEFPAAEVAELGYRSAAHGDGRWNGVAVLSRVGLDDVRRGFSGEPVWTGEPDGAGGASDPGRAGPASDPAPPMEAEPLFTVDAPAPVAESRAIQATCGGVRVCSVYVPNGRSPLSAHYTYKLDWLAALHDALGAELGRTDSLVLCGDFNVAPTDADVWDPAAFVGSTHVTEPERQALAKLRALGLTDVVPRPMKGPNPFTYWDYRAGMFHQDKGMRIDLVYASEPVAARVESAYIDREARKGKGPSDHAPIVVDLR